MILHYVEMIRIPDQRTAAVLKQIRRSVSERPDSLLARQTMLAESIPGAGFLTAVTIVCEMAISAPFADQSSFILILDLTRQSGSPEILREPI